MTVHLTGRVLRGELSNTSWYRTDGWLEVRGLSNPVRLELTGNCAPDLIGCRISFESNEADADAELPPRFATEQIGPTGTITASDGLHLEWFGQNGRVVVDLPRAVVELLERTEWTVPSGIGELPPEPELLPPPTPADETEIDEEPMASRSLEDQFEAEAEEIDRAIRGEDESRRTAEEGDELVREMELMDALIESGPGEPLCELFEDPLRLPRPDALDDAAVEKALKALLAQLAVFNVSLSVCPHYSVRDAYRLMLERICPNERAYSELRGTGWIQHFMTHEFCPQCDAEAEREYEEMQRKRLEEGDDSADEPDDDDFDEEDMPF